MKSFWLVKQEPSSYSWSDLVAEGQTSWTGVRNYAARNNLRKMQKGDEVLFYHSGEEKAVVGIAKVTRTAYRDSTASEGDWSTVDLAPLKPLRHPVTLREAVTSPAGTTIMAIRELERHGVRAALLAAIEAARDRSQELGRAHKLD